MGSSLPGGMDGPCDRWIRSMPIAWRKCIVSTWIARSCSVKKTAGALSQYPRLCESKQILDAAFRISVDPHTAWILAALYMSTSYPEGEQYGRLGL
eukprot:scaffold519_cov331-Pavlova_lutheri.AAC.11